MKITTDLLIDLGFEARQDIPEPWGYCYPASRYIVKKLHREYGLTDKEASVKEVRVGNAGTIRHYVARINADCVEDSNYTGSLLIDATLDQYCDYRLENGDVRTSFGSKESIEPVNVFVYESTPYTSIR